MTALILAFIFGALSGTAATMLAAALMFAERADDDKEKE